MPRKRRTWGGARAGAGRPPIGSAPLLSVSVQLPPDVVAYLDSIQFRNASGEFERLSRSEALRRVLAIGASEVEKRSGGRVKAPPSAL